MAVPETETRSKGGKLIALTFDDGPGPYTRRLLEGLAKRGVKATFFMLGQQAENYDVTAGLVRDAGHQIASHTYDHPQLSKKTDSQVTWQISHTADILNRITGYGTHYLVRPPYGDYNSRVLSLLDNPAISGPSIRWTGSTAMPTPSARTSSTEHMTARSCWRTTSIPPRWTAS